MTVKHIIIQSGGLGTRLGKLTLNKPKGLVAVNNRPILFHVFERFPDAHFVIIGDYKYSVLESYLRTFAKVDYALVHAVGKGNAAGINAALEHIPSETPFMLLWSDVLLSKDLRFEELPDGNYIGITSQFPCSWQIDGGVLRKKPGGKQCVAGLFIFKDKSALAGLPEEGGMTRWLGESGIELKPLDMRDSREAGTLEAVGEIDGGAQRCRPYNSLEFDGDKVVKSALAEDGQALLDKEIAWYRAMREYGFPHIPEIFSCSPLTMSRIHGKNIFGAELSEDGKRRVIARLVDALHLMHGYGSRPADTESLDIEYFAKTLARLDSIKAAIPFASDALITINGKKCRNVLFFRNEFHDLVKERLFDAKFAPIHGDATLTNTMTDEAGDISFIDARGYFGKNEVFGDIYYDWAKLYYSISGNFDNFNIKKFDLEIGEREVKCAAHSNGWEPLAEYFLSLIPNCDIGKIKLIHAIIWLSLASHCWEDFDSLCAAFYIGTNLLEDCWGGLLK